jgi:hypothetical protein
VGVSGDLASALAGALPPARDPRRTADDDQYPVPPAAPPGDVAPVTLTNSVRTSWPEPLTGNGPWLVYLPRDEASRVVGDRVGTYGTEPPRGYLGSAEPVTAAMMPRRAGDG